MPSHTDPNMLLSFILLLLIASFTAYYASRKGRSPVVWFVIGVLLGIFAPLILLFFPAVKNEKGDQDTPTMTVSNPDPALEHTQPVPISSELKFLEDDKLWYYLDQNHQQMGPVSVIALRELWNRGQLELTSYVWSEGMPEWKKVETLPELKDSLNKLV